MSDDHSHQTLNEIIHARYLTEEPVSALLFVKFEITGKIYIDPTGDVTHSQYYQEQRDNLEKRMKAEFPKQINIPKTLNERSTHIIYESLDNNGSILWTADGHGDAIKHAFLTAIVKDINRAWNTELHKTDHLLGVYCSQITDINITFTLSKPIVHIVV